jgi:hypothetical protein
LPNYIYEEAIHKLLIETRGNKCERCGAIGKELVKHHKDWNRSNWEPSNLLLLCKSCNAELTIGRNQQSPPIKLKKKQTLEDVRRTLAQTEIIDRNPNPLGVNRDKYPKWWAWMIENVSRQSGVTYHEAIYEAAEAVGLNHQTTRGYLEMKIAARKLRLSEGSKDPRKVKVFLTED